MAKKNIGTHTDPKDSFLAQEAKPSKKARKQAKKETRKSKGKIPKGFLILIGLLLLLGLSLLIVQYWDNIIGGRQNPAATVNGETITMSELNELYDRLPAQTKAVVTRQDLLDQMINEKILVMEAESKGILVSPNETEDFLSKLIAQSGLSREEFNQRIEAQNITPEMINDEVYKQIIITKLYQQEILDKTNVTDKQVEDYYIENFETFKQPAQVRAEHILVCHNESFRCVSNLTKEEAFALMRQIKAKLANTSFEDLAKEYSQDPSKDNGGDLGYFARGEMVKPFEEAAFNTSVGNVSDIVETEYGYHLIKVLDKKAETISPLDEVKDEIRQALAGTDQQESFKEYLDNLKAKTDIKVFLPQDQNTVSEE